MVGSGQSRGLEGSGRMSRMYVFAYENDGEKFFVVGTNKRQIEGEYEFSKGVTARKILMQLVSFPLTRPIYLSQRMLKGF